MTTPDQPADRASNEVSPGDSLLNQDELDRLITQASALSSTTPTESISRDSSDLDRFMQDVESPQPTAAPSPVLDDADIKDLLDAAISTYADSSADSPVPQAVLDEELSQHEIDDLLTGQRSEDALGGSALDSVIAEVATTEMDEPLSDVAKENSTRADEVIQPRPPASAPQDLSIQIESELRQAADQASQFVGSENIAAAAASLDDPLLSNDVLDSLVDGIRKQGEPSTPAPEPTMPIPAVAPSGPPEIEDDAVPVAAQPPARRSRFRKPIIPRLTKRQLVKGLAALTVGILVTGGTFIYLSVDRLDFPWGGPEASVNDRDPARILEHAQSLIDAGRFQEALAEIDPLINSLTAVDARETAKFLHAKALHGDLGASALREQIDPVSEAIDNFIDTAPTHSGVAEALLWRADLQERSGDAFSARQTLFDVLNNYGNSPVIDAALLHAAKLALKSDEFADASDLLRRLLDSYPSSVYADEARLLLGETYAAAGEPEQAQDLLTQVAEEQSGKPLGAEAVVRLARIDYDVGDYTGAIERLENHLEKATSIEGNDAVYLLLAQAHHALGQHQDAERVLRELLDFFPVSDVTPQALVELSKVLDALGQRSNAQQVANRAAQQFPDDPAVLRNHAAFLTLVGRHREAADALLQADAAGAADPGGLLEAGRSYHRADALPEAVAAYQRLLDHYSASPQAFEGGIEIANVFYDLGQVTAAVERLDSMATAAEGRPQRVPALLALGRIYEDLGLDPSAAAVFREIAAETTEPNPLANAAVALLKAGFINDGVAVARRVDVDRLTDTTAYDFLLEYGKAMRQASPLEGLRLIEQAYETYPSRRTPYGDQLLLETYLATDHPARARTLVVDIAAIARQDEVQAHRLRAAAVAWGDYLFEKNDFRTAADAYAMAIEVGNVRDEDTDWAEFQRASALLRLRDYETSLPVLDRIAASNSSWAEQARLKAGYARLEQKYLGLPVTPVANAEE